MSFILDALKKLEKSKQRSSVPDLLTDHRAVFNGKDKKSIWPFLIFAALSLNVIVILLWLSPWKSQEVIPAPIKSAGKQENTVPEKTMSSSGPLTPQAPVLESKTNKEKPLHEPFSNTNKTAVIDKPTDKNTVENAPAKKIVPEPVSRIEPEVNINDTPGEAEDIVKEQNASTERTLPVSLNPSEEDLKILRDQIKEEQKAVMTTPDEDNIKGDAPSAPGGSVPEFSQLSDSTKKNIPKISISGHIFSNNSRSRIVSINGSIFREGETVSAGLKLEEITITGVILNYQGTRFSMRAF